jgi:hypothetical protein
VIDDIALMRDFWPTEMVDDSRRGGYGTIYMMDEKTMTKVQTNIRTTLDKLATLGYLEKIGNDDERRWKPIKALRGVTLS